MNDSQIRQIIQQELKTLLFSKQKEQSDTGQSLVRAAQQTLQPTVTTTTNRDTQEVPKSPELNYITEGTYKGETRYFALSGQVVDPKDNAAKNSDNFMQFSGKLIDGNVNGQLLVWNEFNKEWNLFTPPSGSGKFIFYWNNDTSQWETIQRPSFDNAVLAYTGNNLGWIQIDECVPTES